MSISQAGIYSLKLYENKDFTFEYNESELIILSSISNTGDILELETNDNFIKYDNKLVPAENNTTLNDHTLAFEINGLIQSNLDIIEKLQSSIYGWIALITFMDTQVYLINIPFHPKVDKFDSQVTHTFFIEMKPRIFTFEKLEGVNVVSIPVLNSGATGTTDWVDSNTDGLGDNWGITNFANPVTPSIITGSGFNANAQRIDMDNGGCAFICDLIPIVSGQSYSVYFKYRSDMPTIIANVRVRDSVGAIIANLDGIQTNTGNPTNYISDSFIINDTQMDIYIYFLNTITQQYFEIDQVQLIQQ